MSHSILSPSKAPRWVSCPGSVPLSKDVSETTSSYATEGTQAHEYGAWLLRGAVPPVPPADREMVDYVSVYTNAVRRAAEGKTLLVEHVVDISPYTSEPGGKGTADAIIFGYDCLEVHDLKFGRGHLIDAENNMQLMLYALGALDIVEPLAGEVSNVKLVIHQPRRDHYSEWTVSREALMEFGRTARKAGEAALALLSGLTYAPDLGMTNAPELHPSDKACLWCPVKATCPALTDLVQQAAMADFAAEDVLPTPSIVGAVKAWIDAVEAHIFAKLQRFEPVPGWKLVAGRPGNRAWSDAGRVEELLAAWRVKKAETHEMKLRSPAQLEKVVTEKKWALLEPLLERAGPKPMMVAETDKRPALEQAKEEEFDVFS